MSQGVEKRGDSGWLYGCGPGPKRVGWTQNDPGAGKVAHLYTKGGVDTEIERVEARLEEKVNSQTQAAIELGSQKLEERSAELRDRVSEIGSAIEPTRDKVQELEETVARQQETIDTLQAQVALLVQRLEAVEGTEN